MPKLSWVLLPLTLLVWYRAYWLHYEALGPLFPQKSAQPAHGVPQPSSQGSNRSLVPSNDTKIILDDSAERIFWFIQISDLHISVFKRRYLDKLVYFLNRAIPSIDPAFVLVTGDLTDAKDWWKVSSKQMPEEWIAYKTALDESGVLQKPNFWWDQRGNHDCFNVPGWDSHHNYFRELSGTKQEQYAFQYQTEYGNYSFISLDACPIYGPSRPFNFFGYFDNADMDFLQSRLLSLAPSNHTFLLSHYPISMTVTGKTSNGMEFDTLARHFSVLLCGHLHKLAGGLGEIMHAHHEPSFLELELADMKSHGYFRVMAIDNDLISFVDSSILNGEAFEKNMTLAPVVLITNPKDSRYLILEHEPVHRIRTSTHIRVLVFSDELAGIEMRIDEKTAALEKSPDSSVPLYVAPWDPISYDDGRAHTIEVCAKDIHGRTGCHSVIFRVDGILEPLEIGPGQYILKPDYAGLFKNLFLTVYFVIAIVLLIIPKLLGLYLHKTRKYHRWRVQFSNHLISLDKTKKIPLPENIIARFFYVQYLRLALVYHDFVFFLKASFFRLVTLTSLAYTFYPIYIYTLYITIGPLFIGELIPSSRLQSGRFSMDGFGYFYLYGIFVENHWLPLTDTWLFALFELAYLLAPLIVYLSFCITPPEQLYAPMSPYDPIADKNVYFFPPRHNRRRFPLHRRIPIRVMVSGVVFYQLINVFFIGLYYGPWAMIISPGKTWMVVWSVWALWRHRWSSIGREVDLDDESNEDNVEEPFFYFASLARLFSPQKPSTTPSPMKRKQK